MHTLPAVPNPPEKRPPIPLPDASPLAPPEDFVAQARAAGVEIAPERVTKLGEYLGYLLEMNERMNLTAIADPAEAWTRHGLDALTLLPLMAELPARARVVDVGSGGGVPAIPLAIARPDLSFTLVEATQKKAGFLKSVARALGLKNVTVLAERAERAAHGADREGFDAVTARAVGRLAALAEITVPFAKVGGRALLVKGQRAEEELAEAQDVIARAGAEHERTVPTPTGRIVVLVKRGHTPRTIPRR